MVAKTRLGPTQSLDQRQTCILVMIEEPELLTVKRNPRRPAPDQIGAFKSVPTSQVVDALGGSGSLATSIRPIGNGCQAAGPALTANNGPADILATLAALNFVQQGDILVACGSGFQGCAAVGDNAMGMLRNGGGIAFVTDCPARDREGILKVGLPVWCTGLNPNSPFSNGPGEVGLPIQIGGQRVESGDMIVADSDGVVVVPFFRIDEVIGRLQTVNSLESAMQREIGAGRRTLQRALDVLADERTQYVD